MKCLSLLVFLCAGFLSGNAQRFYYLETNNLVDQALRTRLENKQQTVVRSVMASDVIVKTVIDHPQGTNELHLEVVVADSVTLEPLVQTQINYHFGVTGTKPEVVYQLAIRSFIEQHLDELIFRAGQQHGETFDGDLKAKKGKS